MLRIPAVIHGIYKVSCKDDYVRLLQIDYPYENLVNKAIAEAADAPVSNDDDLGLPF